MSSTPPAGDRRTAWFWGNLVALLVLLPFATYWFQQHLRPYFTQIVIIGGTFTLWALVRMLWGLFEKATQFDAWDHSRRLLSAPGTTRLIVVGALAMLVLWRTTSSIYVEYAGTGGENEYVVQVSRKQGAATFLDDIVVNSAHPIAGRPLFWQSGTVDLVCSVLRPVRYEQHECTISPGHSTRVAVPHDFKEKEFHLIRLVPGKALYPELPDESDQPVTRYDLRIAHGDQVQVLQDLRRQTIYVGAKATEMKLALGLENPEAFERMLTSRLRAAQLDAPNAAQMAAVLAGNTRPWPVFYLRAGDQISVTVNWSKNDSEQKEGGTVEDFPVKYTVTDEKVQTLWLPGK